MDKAKMIFMYLAFVTPPWNILCWLTGAGIYYLGGCRKDDASGDGFMFLVLGAPASLPVLAYAGARKLLTGKDL